MNTFQTQADIQRYLLEEEGRKVTNGKDIYGYKDGHVWCFTGDFVSTASFSVVSDWRPYQEPRPWYETVEPRTVLCWFWDDDEDFADIGLLLQYNRSGTTLYLSGEDWYENCRPLTPAEIEPFLEAARRIAND